MTQKIITTFLLTLLIFSGVVFALEEQKITASDADALDEFGTAVSISGDYAIVGASRNSDDGYRSGAVYIFVRNGEEWIEQAKLTASDADREDYFGRSVSIDGDNAIVSSYRNDDDGIDSGSAYIFIRNGEEWVEHSKLTASDANSNDFFGWRVSIDSNYAIISAHGNDENGEDSGSAFIFFNDEEEWLEQVKLSARDINEDDHFGKSVSIDGDYVLVGANRDTQEGIRSGSAFIFTRDGEDWYEHAKVVPSDADSADHFGFSVDICGDLAIVGAPANNVEGFVNSGSAYIFEKEGDEWREQAKLIASDADSGDQFGFCVSIEENYAVVGAHGNNNDGGDWSGSAYIFIREGNEWIERRKLIASDIGREDGFGYFVSANGDNVIIGSPGHSEDGENSGAAYIYSGLGSLVTVPDATSNSNLLPISFLCSTYPNPFNSMMTITFNKTYSGYAKLSVCDLSGKEVSIISSGKFSSGSHSETWSAVNFPAGTYTVRIKTEKNCKSFPVTLLK